MSILIVGGDTLGSIPERLRSAGAEEIIHWRGRDMKDMRREIPRRIDMIVVMCDFVNHNLVRRIKASAERSSIPVIYSRRSATFLEGRIVETMKRIKWRDLKGGKGR